MEKLAGDDDAIRAAVVRFYDALEALVVGKGSDALKETWEHTSRVTASHPLGE